MQNIKKGIKKLYALSHIKKTDFKQPQNIVSEERYLYIENVHI